MRALPFGASASVLGFNWAARALSVLLVDLFFVGSTAFYDDFTIVEAAHLAKGTDETIEAFFRLLGWNTKDLAGFNDVLEPLGAVLDLTDSAKGEAVLRNKPERVRDIESEVRELMEAPVMTGKPIARLRGRLLFSRALCFGRAGGIALRSLSKAAANPRAVVAESAELKSALTSLVAHLQVAPPRPIRAVVPPGPVLFTDGMVDEVGPYLRLGIGATLLDPRDGTYSYFSLSWRRRAQKAKKGKSSRTENPIHRVELLPVAVSVCVWRERLAHRGTLTLVDNEGARAALVAGGSANLLSANLVELVDQALSSDGAAVWYDRAPSDSNLADAPSRGQCPQLLPGWPAPVEVTLTEHLQNWCKLSV